jgi:hypothetical protein
MSRSGMEQSVRRRSSVSQTRRCLRPGVFRKFQLVKGLMQRWIKARKAASGQAPVCSFKGPKKCGNGVVGPSGPLCSRCRRIGLVEKVPSERDRRVIYLQITSPGNAAFTERALQGSAPFSIFGAMMPRRAGITVRLGGSRSRSAARARRSTWRCARAVGRTRAGPWARGTGRLSGLRRGLGAARDPGYHPAHPLVTRALIRTKRCISTSLIVLPGRIS